MRYILCYGDSNTWGCVPAKFTRYDFQERWPGVMQAKLGAGYHVYENALNGRTTVFEDPIEEHRSGKEGFEIALMSTAPLDLVIFMLGTNDTKDRHNQSAWDITWGMELLTQYVRKAKCGRGGGNPGILILSPIHLNDDWGESLHHTVFSAQSIEKSRQLAKTYEFLATMANCHFLDAALYAQAKGDGVHMTAEGHKRLGEAVAQKVESILGAP